MNYAVLNATIDDFGIICKLFDDAIKFQKNNDYIGWSSYDEKYIKQDIQNKLLFKIIREDEILCIFSICFHDPLIWREKEKGDAIYLHRAVLNQRFKGEKAFNKILEWTINFANEKKLKFIRIDTWAENDKLIAYYKKYGFKFIENYTTPNTKDLPIQHRNLEVALLELCVQTAREQESYFLDSKAQAPLNDIEKVNVNQQFSTINKYWNQKIIGQANGQLIKLAKGIGEINWHKHDEQDELFIVYKGHLTIQLKDKSIELYPNDLFIVPKGMEHCPKAHGEVEFLIMGLSIISNSAGGRPDNFKYDLSTL